MLEETEAADSVPTSSAPLPELTLGSEAGTAAEEQSSEPSAAVNIRGRLDRFGVAMGTGRRKTSVARVRIRPGSGAFTVNDRPLENFFLMERDRNAVMAPLKAVEQLGAVDVWVQVKGGGTTGQAGAVLLGVARAMEALNPALHTKLATGGFLTRDDRAVERKKYGRKKARRSFQFSKR